jgi:membrane dipeptidase
VRDEALKACAETGGVVGVNGIGDFLGDEGSLPELLVRHIDYLVQHIGPDHVGLGTDYVFDQSELEDYLRNNPQLFPGRNADVAIRMLAPESLCPVTAGLLRLGYRHGDVKKILGGNFLRVARETWPSARGPGGQR